jgi:outer membrane receptor for ferrienterochelin and colicins
MKRMAMSILLILLCLADITFAQKAPTDANIVGHVLADGMHIPFATISIKGTTLGVSTDETGHYRFINLPTGKHTLVARSVGYQQCETEVEIYTGQTKEINFQLKKSVQDIDEVEVTGHKNIVNRQAEPTIINTISPQLFANTQAVVLSQGLNYVPGLRMETKCVNSGFPQLRINGLDGIYSQVLINGRRMFRGMASVFGLEQVPSGIIDQVKVVRGGGSVLYGNNGIAGTIDLVLKEPINNSYEVGTHTSIIGVGLNKAGPTATDYTINMNTSIVSEDRNSGMTLYGFYRNTEPFDANNDSFSEMPETENITLGARLFHRMRNRNKLTLDFINISEKRRGGNQFELPMPLAEMAAAPEHGIKNVALNYGQFFRDIDKLSIYAAGQNVYVDA